MQCDFISVTMKIEIPHKFLANSATPARFGVGFGSVTVVQVGMAKTQRTIRTSGAIRLSWISALELGQQFWSRTFDAFVFGAEVKRIHFARASSGSIRKMEPRGGSRSDPLNFRANRSGPVRGGPVRRFEPNLEVLVQMMNGLGLDRSVNNFRSKGFMWQMQRIWSILRTK